MNLFWVSCFMNLCLYEHPAHNMSYPLNIMTICLLYLGVIINTIPSLCNTWFIVTSYSLTHFMTINCIKTVANSVGSATLYRQERVDTKMFLRFHIGMYSMVTTTYVLLIFCPDAIISYKCPLFIDINVQLLQCIIIIILRRC